MSLDKDNKEFNKAAEFVHQTDKIIYLTGKAGTGKTTFLKHIKKTSPKNIVILAPTGVAAINAGGVTINSFFQLPFGPFVPNDERLSSSKIFSTFRYRENKKKIILNLELLIIDEISMVRSDTLDVINQILQVFRRNAKPFGGVQVVLIGDVFQLSPIANNVWPILSEFYKSIYFFDSKVIQENPLVYIELKKIYRQNEQDFIDLLNRVRVNKLIESDIKSLNSKFDPEFEEQDYVTLATHNSSVNSINANKLAEINEPPYTYEGIVTDAFPEREKPTDHLLELKVGAQVMFVKNDSSTPRRYHNGKIGEISSLNEDAIHVRFFDSSKSISIERALWQSIRYTYNQKKKKIEEEILGTYEQFPLRLAWAMTVHKSQGLTFEKVIADLGSAFAFGQVYVALSRCTSFKGLKLKSPITSEAIITDKRVLDFASNKIPSTLITEQLNAGKADFYYKSARTDFGLKNIKAAFSNLKKALIFRNDIETDLFERYMVIQAGKLISANQKSSKGTKSIITSLEKKNKAQKEFEAHLTDQIFNQKMHESDLDNQIDKLKEELDQLKKENLSVKSEYLEYKRTFQRSIDEQNSSKDSPSELS